MRRRAVLRERDLGMSPTHFLAALAATAELHAVSFDDRLGQLGQFSVGDSLFPGGFQFSAASGTGRLAHRHLFKKGVALRRRRLAMAEWPLTWFATGAFALLLAFIFAERGGRSGVAFEPFDFCSQFGIHCG